MKGDFSFESASIQVCDAFGRIVHQEMLTSGENYLDLKNIVAGVYFLRVVSDSGFKVFPLVIEY